MHLCVCVAQVKNCTAKLFFTSTSEAWKSEHPSFALHKVVLKNYMTEQGIVVPDKRQLWCDVQGCYTQETVRSCIVNKADFMTDASVKKKKSNDEIINVSNTKTCSEITTSPKVTLYRISGFILSSQSAAQIWHHVSFSPTRFFLFFSKIVINCDLI